MRLLLIEGNPRCLIARGYPAYSNNFIETLSTLDPELQFTIAEPFERPLSETVLDAVGGVVFTGSSIDAAMDAPDCRPQRAAMELVFKHGLPSWGACAGLQLAAIVLGGEIGASPKGVEIGLAQGVRLTEAGRHHAMMAGRSSQGFAVPCTHRDEVQKLPAGAQVLAWNAHCPIQAFAYEANGIDFWGTQYHPELAPDVIAAGVRRQSESANLAALLEMAEFDDACASALGGTRQELLLPQRCLEMSNWLAHVRSRQTADIAMAL